MQSHDLSKYLNITESDYCAVAGPDWPTYNQFLNHQHVPNFVYEEIDSMLTGPELLDNSAFCVLPFYNLEIPLNTPCCLIEPGADIDQIKVQMLSNQRPNACYKCWQLEDNGIKSDRMIKNETLDYYADKNLKNLFDQCVQGNNAIINYKIDTSSVCNATCVTCNSDFSSSWAQLERKNNQPTKKSWRISPEEIEPKIDFSNAKAITFRGGEPFLSDTNFYILEQLLAHNNNQCLVSFTTNGSSVLNDYQKSLISKFKNVNFCISIDGIGSVFEYLRYPLLWSDIETTVDYCRANNIMISASYTISNLNILYHPQTVQWFHDNQIDFIHNPVYSPAYFQPQALPQSIKKAIVDRCNDSTVTTLLSQHITEDDQKYQDFRVEIAKQDHWKNIQLRDYLPELAVLLDKYSG